MVLTFGEMVAQLAIDLKYGPESGDDVLARLRRLVNEGYRRILRAGNFADQREITLPFRTANYAYPTAIYGLPLVFDRIQRFWQPTGSRKLVMRTPDWLLATDPQDSSIGTPEAWIPIGPRALQRPPVAGHDTSIYVQSTSVEDAPTGTPVEARIVCIEDVGADTVNPPHSAGVTTLHTAQLSGTAQVSFQIGAGRRVRDVVSFTLDRAAKGEVYLTDDSLTRLATIAANQLGSAATSSQYYGVRLWPSPADTYEYLVTGTMRIPDLFYDTDVPRLSPEYGDALMVYARMREYKTTRADNDRFLIESAEWDRVMGELRGFAQFPPEYRPVAGGQGDGARWSNLGGYFPPDNWNWYGY